ncbi:hypothetical protein ABT084_31990 [Streptomyces sp. NPDC002138]|uniref:hypothetical protein n=1 Tax=Streptomyces sp. NPDC002138 TaxID=3154410 RepID=UPI0033296E9D
MEDREILSRFKSGTLERRRAVALLTGGPSAAPGPVEPRREAPAPPTAAAVPEPCAVIALEGRFPRAVDLAAFWQRALTPDTAPAPPAPRGPAPGSSSTTTPSASATSRTGCTA